MPKKRRNNPLNLPERVYAKHGAFYYVHPDGRWERIGTDLAEARKRGILYNDDDDENQYGTVSYWLDHFILHCEERTYLDPKKGGMAKRTLSDYKETLPYLKAFFGDMQVTQVQGFHVAEYLDIGQKSGRPVRANREKSTLSSCFSWLMRKEESGVTSNPCFGIRKNRENKRERYVTNTEYQAVMNVANKKLRAFSELIYRTLQRPEDVLNWTPADIINKRNDDGTYSRVIRNDQRKRMGNGGKVVDILITPEIDEILKSVSPLPPIKLDNKTTFIRNRQDMPYTYDGISGMLRKAIHKAGVPIFSFYDMKGKGATDMWRAKVPLEQIQILCGHESITTTEIYVKARWVDTVLPNFQPLEK